MSLIDDVLEILTAANTDERSVDLVLASMAGPEALGAAMQGETVPRPGTSREAVGEEAAGAYLASIEATGFRGIGPTARLELEPGPGLTLVVGRNGSGKSSFAEALEVLLTGDSYRWKNKPAEWKQGWRNLHHPRDSSVSAQLAVEGAAGPTVATRTWDDDARDAADGETVVAPHDAEPTDLGGYGWAEAIDLHRPLLSHPELGVVAENPSSLFDALSSVLGLDDLAAAADLIRRTRLDAEKPLKEARKKLKDDFLPALAESEDERAAAATAAISGRSWDLEGASVIAAGLEQGTDSLASLDLLSRLTVPDHDIVVGAATRLETALSALKEQEWSESGRSRRSIDLLEAALAEHADHGDQACPVCGVGALDAGWRTDAEAQVAQLRRAAADYDAAVGELEAATRAGRELVRSVPAVLSDPPEGLDTSAAREAWGRWADLPSEPADLAAHLRDAHGDLSTSVKDAAAAASARRSELEDAWRPLATRLAAWVEEAGEAQQADARAKTLKVAEDALGEATIEIRTRRFQPISDAAIDLWESLRLQSNVELTGVELSGKGTRRRVDLSVNVDGTESAALGVVSQGEVNCLALSLFFPRVMLPESPFRFIVIDDPVQAMDPARVDGLARVFVRVAESRQLVVFTHDDRLPASLQRLGLAHTTLEVTRRPGSLVEVRKMIDPVNQYFFDARAVEKDDKLPDAVASRVVPGFCRSGIEAACMETVRRRRIGRGDSHLAVERELSSAQRTTELVALALFDDAAEGGRVLGEINRRWGREAGDAYRDVNEGAHKGFGGSLGGLIAAAQKLATGLRASP